MTQQADTLRPSPVPYARPGLHKPSRLGMVSCLIFGAAVVIFGFAMYCAWPALVRDNVYQGGIGGGPATALGWAVMACVLSGVGLGFGIAGITGRLDESRLAILGAALNAPLCVFGLTVIVMLAVAIARIGPY